MSKNIFRASYLTQQASKKLIYKPLTEPSDTNYYQPDWSPLGNDIVCLGDYENKNEVLLIRVVDKKITSTGSGDTTFDYVKILTHILLAIVSASVLIKLKKITRP